MGGLLYAAVVSASAPSDIQPTLNSCEGFVKATAKVVFHDGYGRSKPAFLAANNQEWLLVDTLWGNRSRLSWHSFGPIKSNRPGDEQTNVLPTTAKVVVDDLWTACRDGFEGVTWSQVSPKQDGYWYDNAQISWAKGTIAEQWANGMAFYLGVWKKDKQLTEIVWKVPEGPEPWGRINVLNVDWQSTKTINFSTLAPYPPLVLPPELVQVK